MKNLGKDLAKLGRKKGMCKEYLYKLPTITDRKELAEIFIREIDFCLSNDFPSLDYIETHFKDITGDFGVFTVGQYSQVNKRHLVALGTATGSLRMDGFNVAEVFVRDQAYVNLSASENSFCMVDLYSGRIHVRASQNAKVVVNDYGGRISQEISENGLVKIIRKTKKSEQS